MSRGSSIFLLLFLLLVLRWSIQRQVSRGSAAGWTTFFTVNAPFQSTAEQWVSCLLDEFSDNFLENIFLFSFSSQEVEEVTFITHLAGLTDHIPVGLRLNVKMDSDCVEEWYDNQTMFTACSNLKISQVWNVFPILVNVVCLVIELFYGWFKAPFTLTKKKRVQKQFKLLVL